MVINMCEYNNVPKIRFKGFTDVWEQRKLNELCNIYDGTHQTPNYKDSGIMFLSVENIKDLSSNKYISYEDFKKIFKVYPEKNDILMTRIGDIGTTNIVKENSLKAYYVSLALLKCRSINPYYLNFAIKSDYVQNGLKLRSLLTAIPMKINKDQIGEVDINYPIDPEEQSNIGKLFDNLDNLITLHQRKCDNLINVKKSLLEKMFPKNSSNIPEIRFKGFTDVWEQRKLEDITQIVMGQSPDSINYTDNSDDTVLIQGNADLNNGIVVPRIWSSQITKKSYPNDIIFTVRAPVGEIARNPYFATIGRGVASFKGNDFLYQSLIQKKENNYWNNISAGSTFDSINSDQLKNVIIYLPKNNLEQEKIGELFTNLDNLITLHQRKLEKLKNIKKSMLEKMFV